MHCELRLSEDGRDICVRDASMNGVGVVGPNGGRPTPATKGRFDLVPEGGALLVPLKLNSKHGERVLLRILRGSSRPSARAAAPRALRPQADAFPTTRAAAAADALEAEGGAYSDREGGDEDRASESPMRAVPHARCSPRRKRSPSLARVDVSGLWEMTSDQGRSFEYLWQHLTPRTFSGKQVGGSAVSGTLSRDGTIMWETGAVACKAMLLECGKRIESGSFWRKKSGEVLGTFAGVLRKAGHMKPEERSAEEIPMSQSLPDKVGSATASQPFVRQVPQTEDKSEEYRSRRRATKERKASKGPKKRRRDRSGSAPRLSFRAGSSPARSSRGGSPPGRAAAALPGRASPRASSRWRSPGGDSPPRWRRRRHSSASPHRAQRSSLSRAQSLGNGHRDGKRRRRR